MSGIQQLLLGGPFGGGAVGDPYWQYTNLLLGTGATNGSQNNTFTDSSSNAFTITRNGNTTQGSFSPFSAPSGYWGNYFDGNGDYLNAGSNSAFSFGTGAYTVEMWVYPNSISQQVYLFNDTTNGFGFYFETTSSAGFTIAPRSGAGAVLTGGYSALNANQWNHIVAVRSSTSSNATSIFVNGTRVANGTDSTNWSVTGPLLLGGLQANVYQFAGYISNCRVVKGTAVYDPTQTTLTVPTSPLTAITNTSLLTCQSNRFVDNSSNAFAITVSGTPSVVPFAPLGNTSAYNTSGVGGSGYFDGTGDYLTVATASALQFGTGDLTVEFWVYGLASGRQDWFEMPGTNRIQFLFEGTNVGVYINNSFVVGAANTPVLNQWNHIAWTRSSGTNRVFLNGVKLGSDVSNSTNFSDNSVTIGTSSGGTDTKGYFAGVRILKGTAQYTAAFTPPTAPLTNITNTSLLLNFTNAAIFDNAAKNDMETVGNAQVSTSVTKFGNSVYMDGNGDYLVGSQPTLFDFGTGDFTIEGWFYFNAINTTGATVLFSTQTAGVLQLGTESDVINLGRNSSSNIISAAYTSSLLLNTWTHIAVSRTGSLVKMFVNGNQIGSGTNSDSFDITTYYLGRQGTTGTHQLNGYISNFRITNGVGRYNYNFPTPTQAFGTIYAAPVTPAADPYFDYTTLLLPGSGTNGAQNNTFLDSSTNAFSITRNGNTTQGTFSPFSQTGWSNYFDGNDYLSGIGTTSSFNFMHNTTALFTFECWVYVSSTAATQTLIDNTSGTSSQIGCAIYVDAGGTVSVFITRGVTGVPNVTAYVTSSGTVAVNQWNHIAVTYDQSLGSNNAKFYINGASAGQGSKTGNTPSSSNASNAMRIGTYGAGAGDFVTGYISNLRISNSIVYSAAFTPSTSPLTTSSQGATSVALLTCQSNRFVDNSSNAFAITVNGNPSVQAFSPFAPTAAYSAATNGGSGYFDGSGDYLAFPVITVGSSDLTAECWVYLNSTADQELFGINYNSNQSSYGAVRVQIASGNLRFMGSKDGSSFAFGPTSASKNPTTGQWAHIAVVRSGTTFTLYLNGESVATATSISGSMYEGTFGGRVGNLYWSGGNDYLNGYMSGFRVVVGTAVYTTGFTPPTAPLTAITNTSLLLNFTNAGITDATAKNDLETVGNAQISNTTAKWGSTSMYFDGTGDYTLLPDSQNLELEGDFTIEFWAYPTSASGNRCFISKRASVAVYSPYIIQTEGSSLKMYLSNSGSAWSVNATASTGVTQSTWQHIAMVKYGSAVTLYLNGNSVATGTSSGALMNNTTAVSVGATAADGTDTYQGYMQDVRITKGIARYTQNFTPPTAAFQLL